jgi:hypothetical protein
MNGRITRRGFLRGTAAGAAGWLILRDSRTAFGYAANEKLNVALVGVGGRGTWFVDTIPRMEQVAVVCDVHDAKITNAFQHWKEFGERYGNSPHEWERRAGGEFRRLAEKNPEVYHDFREMLDKSGQRIDAVVVATPDHSHAVVSAAAIRAGKPVFCEKPLTRVVAESRDLRELARKHQVVTAMGNQGTYSGPFRRAVEMIREGVIGEIQAVHVWNSGGGADRKEPPQGEQPVPAGLNWDLWLGPAQARPFHREWMQRHSWREFGTCQLGNWASHSANLAFMAMKVHDLWLGQAADGVSPVVRVEAETSGINRLSFPRWEIVKWHVPPRAGVPPVPITWYNGQAPGVEDIFADALANAPAKDRNNWRFAGTLIVGSKGRIHTTGHNMWCELLPGDRFEGIQCDRPERLEPSRGAEQDFFAACRGGPAPWSNFDYASALNEFLMLGNVATQFDSPIEFDPVAMKILNNAQADAALHYEYRAGWSLV